MHCSSLKVLQLLTHVSRAALMTQCILAGLVLGSSVS